VSSLQCADYPQLFRFLGILSEGYALDWRANWLAIVPRSTGAPATSSGPKSGDEASHALGESEGQLVERARTDPGAFGRLYDRYYSRILNYAYRSTLEVGLAEDLTSNTFFHALRAIGTFRNTASFEAWLYRIARNEIRQHWRRAKRAEHREGWQRDLSRIYFDSRQGEGPEQVEEKMAAFLRVRQALSGLREKYRCVLELRYFEGLSYERTAEVLEKKVGTVKSLAHRGLAMMRRRLMKEDATLPPRGHL
jgi:RNA polymerase sigma-70 factor (ECF subfamily)